MSPSHGASVIECGGGRTLANGAPSAHDFALLEELSFVRREAQAEANLAYEDWRLLRSGDAYAVYRAAQDRADAAQDDLALMTERVDAYGV
jgi:hypothetical protein